MKDLIKKQFIGLTPNPNKLLDYGFISLGSNTYSISRELKESLIARIEITLTGDVKVALTDKKTLDPFTLFQNPLAKGTFINAVRGEVSLLLSDIAAACFDREGFLTPALKDLLDFVQKEFGVTAEYPWADLSGYAVLRRGDTNKWFAVIMTIDPEKLIKSNIKAKSTFDATPKPLDKKDKDTNDFDGKKSYDDEFKDFLTPEGKLEIMDIHIKKETLSNMLKRSGYYLAYHMNKKSWVTVVPAKVSDRALLEDDMRVSYNLALKK